MKSKKIYWIDLPDPNSLTNDDPWINVGTFDKRKDAIKFLEDKYGIRKQFAKLFIAIGEI